ncbi:hypothetical protein UlMin_012968 [Ulmus minor]
MVPPKYQPRRLLLYFEVVGMPPATGDVNYDAEFDRNMAVVLAALLCALIFALGLHSILRCALRCSRRFFFQTFDRTPGGQVIIPVTEARKSVVSSQIPEMVYGTEGINIPATECPICLGEFEEGERVRILPRCNHGFHAKCIDTWLAFRSSCPLCRQRLLG